MTRSTSGDDTRTRIMRAAELLFAARGIEGVSLREINRAAGQSNTGAVQYHFGDREGLVHGVIERHRSDTEPRRHALLDQYEEAAVPDVRSLAAALVLPLAAKLADPDGGRAYLQIAAEFYGRPTPLAELIPVRDPGASMERWNQLLDPLLTVDPRPSLSPRAAAIRFAFVELARRAAGSPSDDDRLYVSHLIDLVATLLAAEPSEQTNRLSRKGEPGPVTTTA
ncbi:MAG TPA: helix-turn-helix domain-containing protein [Acidimicrobiales bacterium]|nr:helix-turn-helix domain-containing protein [Acidimicrobiales bacterium]